VAQPPTHNIVLENGRFDVAHGTSADRLRSLFDSIRDRPDTPLAVHFHGGLVDLQSGLATADTLAPLYTGIGATAIFFVWRSGWKEVLENNIPAIGRESLFRSLLTRITQFAKGKIDKAVATGESRSGGPIALPKEFVVRAELDKAALGQQPFPDVKPHNLQPDDALTDEERAQFTERLSEDPVFEALTQEISNGLEDPAAASAHGATGRASTATLMSPDVLAELTPPEQEGGRGVVSTALMIARAATILSTVIRRFSGRRDHGFYLTIVEEILRSFYVGNAGRFVWDAMKQDVVDAFGVQSDCGGTAFVDGLAALWRSGRRPPITLIGHSAGAIYVCRLLQEAQARNLADIKFNLVLVAPACDFSLMAKTVQTAGGCIANLRIFGMGDDRERVDAIVPGVYPASLLYFVSGVLEKSSDTPVVGMERYYRPPYTDTAAFPEVEYVRRFAAFDKANSLVWSLAENGDGLNCDMKTHGGWTEAAATLASVLHVLQAGYGDVV
jgi:hypothetical protein